MATAGSAQISLVYSTDAVAAWDIKNSESMAIYTIRNHAIVLTNGAAVRQRPTGSTGDVVWATDAVVLGELILIQKP